tara:strand:+ start:216 stop:473 length:258 start_codon:yes stop_codon:yes gene_type:complete
MSGTNKWIASARVSLDELDKLCKWYPTQRGQFLVQVDDLEKEVKRLRGLLNMIVDKALHEVNTQPNGDDSPYNTILNIAYEGVIE